MRENQGKLEVLLTQRGSNDIFGNSWHSPGSMLRASDAKEEYNTESDYQSAFKRIESELGIPFNARPRFVGMIFHRHLRGVENGLVFISEITGAPAKGQFFPIDALPEPFIEHHRSIITMAIRKWSNL